MKKSVVYTLWGILYAICVQLSFATATDSFGKALFVLTSVLFFLPPFYLLWQAHKKGDKKTIRFLRILSICVLVLAMVLICMNFASVKWSIQTGFVMYVLLVLFAVPLGCCQYWALGLFLWACVLMVTLLYPGRK